MGGLLDWREERGKRRARSNNVDNQGVGKPMVQTLLRKRGKRITAKKEKLKKIKNPYSLFRSETKKLNNKTSLCLRKNRKIISLPQKPQSQKTEKSKTDRTPPKHHNAAHALTPRIALLLLEGHSMDHGGHVPKLIIWWFGLIRPL
jgi:hypothetical protein